MQSAVIMGGSREGGGGGGGQGVQTPLKNNRKYGFFNNTGLDPLENHKATKPVFHDGHHPSTSKTPFRWRFASSLIVVSPRSW